MEVATSDGSIYVAKDDIARGDFWDSSHILSDNEVREKVVGFAGPVIGDEQADRLLQAALTLEHAPDVHGLVATSVASAVGA
jgi:hypothetical protein